VTRKEQGGFMQKLQKGIDFLEHLRIKPKNVSPLLTQEEDEI
jgi:hypothetical protein